MDDTDTMTEERRPLHNPIFDPPEPPDVEPEPVAVEPDDSTVIRTVGEPWTHEHFRALLEILETRPNRDAVAPRFGLSDRMAVGRAASRARDALGVAYEHHTTPADGTETYSADNPPPLSLKTREANRIRVEALRTLAAEGYSTRQIAERIGWTPEHCAMVAKRNNVTVSADAVMSKRPRHDSNRILAEAAAGLDAHATLFSLVDKHALNPDTLPEYIASIRASLSTITKAMKEITT